MTYPDIPLDELGGIGPTPIERGAERLQEGLRRSLRSATGLRRDLIEELRGRRLGYPLHPVLVDVAGAFWTSSITLDLLGALGFKRFRSGADAMLLAGVVSSLPTVSAGFIEWSTLDAKDRVKGLGHGALAGSASALYLVSLALRLTGHRHASFGVSLVASIVVSVAAHFGGKLVFNHGAGQRPEL